MITPIAIDDFLTLDEVPLLDVRTPAEFEHGHVPGAWNLPLFSNEERVKVGTTYKQVSREEAILLGFELTGPKWADFIRTALTIAPGKKVGVHCWRGGMRSGAMAWALDLYGFDVHLIQGGYKQYRRWVRDQFEAKYQLWVLGGMTGSGKTRILHELDKLSQQVVDLEDLAQHQGSSYGTMNKMVQPSQEQFENNLAWQLHSLDHTREIWVEDESLNIGKRTIPATFWQQMRDAPLCNLLVDLEQRITSLEKEYGQLDKEFLIEGTIRIRKRLGPVQTKDAIEAITEGRMNDFIRIVLVYYDKTYRTGLNGRDTAKIYPIKITGADPTASASEILRHIQTIPDQRQGTHSEWKQ